MYGKKRRRASARDGGQRAVCSFCAQEILPGERLWYCSGTTACADCFVPFAREALRPFEYILGEEREI